MNKGFIICLILVASIVFLSAETWHPQISLEEAMKLVQDYIQQENIDISSYYLNAVEMDSTWKTVGTSKKVDQTYWILWWVKPAVDLKESLVIAVSVDGKKIWRTDATKSLVARDHFSKVPAITFEQALQLAKEYINKGNIDISNFNLHQVSFIASHEYWWIWWTHVDGALGNYVEIAVSMDGKVWRMPSM